MDSVIPPLTPPSISQPTTDKMVIGQITELPSMVLALKTGDSLLLKLMMEGGVFKTSLSSDGKSIPVTLKTELPLELVANREYSVSARVLSGAKEQVQVQLISIDNRKPEAFIAPKTNVSVPSKTIVSLAPKIDVAVVKELHNAQEQIKFLPLKLAPLVENMLKDIDLSSGLKQQVLNNVAGIELKIDFKTILPSPMRHNPPLDKVLNQMEQTLQNVAQYQNKPEIATALLHKFNTQVDGLRDLPLAATFSLKGSAQVPVMETELGKILLETNVKLKSDTNVMLQIKEVISSAIKPLTMEIKNQPLQEIISKFIDVSKFEKLFQQFEKINPLSFHKEDIGNVLNQGLKPEQILQLNSSKAILPFAISELNNSNSLNSLLNILKPLKNQRQHLELATRILEKLPTSNEKMLSNSLGFLKAAHNNQVSAWLGEDITAELNSVGNEGKEVITRLNSFLTAANKESPAWRMVEIPFLNGDNLSKIRIALKKPEDEEETQKKKNNHNYGTRFVVETNFTRLGMFQFDGFTLAQDRRFDLIIRTSQEVPKDLCAQIMNLFKSSLHEVNYVGNININVKDHFIKLYAEDALPAQIKKGIYI